MESEKETSNKENSDCKNTGYTFSEDMAILNYMITDNNYLNSSGIKVWKYAEKLQICPGRSYWSMKERFRKIIVKDLKKYNVDKSLAVKITQFMRANENGKRAIRLKNLVHKCE